MKCPKRQTRFTYPVPDRQGRTVETAEMEDCLQQECAWWDKTYEQCPVRLASDFLRDISNSLATIAELMPDLSPETDYGFHCGDCGVEVAAVDEEGNPPPGWVLSEPDADQSSRWLCPKCNMPHEPKL